MYFLPLYSWSLSHSLSNYHFLSCTFYLHIHDPFSCSLVSRCTVYVYIYDPSPRPLSKYRFTHCTFYLYIYDPFPYSVSKYQFTHCTFYLYIHDPSPCTLSKYHLICWTFYLFYPWFLPVPSVNPTYLIYHYTHDLSLCFLSVSGCVDSDDPAPSRPRVHRSKNLFLHSQVEVSGYSTFRGEGEEKDRESILEEDRKGCL